MFFKIETLMGLFAPLFDTYIAIHDICAGVTLAS